MAMPSSLVMRAPQHRAALRAIPHLGTAVTAFVGRTLRGPVNRPVSLKSFAEFQQVFGGLWQPGLVSYAVEQFFDNGGREAVVVRIVNGARPATLRLGTGADALVLRAVQPGTREFLRACVDYDNIAATDNAAFNLTIQRVRAQGTQQVEDQEIHRNVSLLPAAARFIAVVIGGSKLVRLEGAVPQRRPARTVDAANGLSTGYVNSSSDGDDGAPLTDYDVIGSAATGTGLFALAAAHHFNFLCLPPLSREQDLGPGALLVAARFCRARRAMLIIDPPLGWHTVDDALRELRGWDFANEDALMFFPRILAHDKLRGRFEAFAPCGAVAGLLARLPEQGSLWARAGAEEPVLRPGYRPACLVPEDRRARLAALGVNTLHSVRSGVRAPIAARTLAGSSAGSPDRRYLAARRLELFIVNSIVEGTREAALAAPSPARAARVESLVRQFFGGLSRQGAFGERSPEDSYFVICDARLNETAAGSAGVFRLLIGFAAARIGDFHVYRITHRPAASEVSPATVNRLAQAPGPDDMNQIRRLAAELTSSP